MTKLLRPSAAKRWMNCPGSVALCADLPEGEAGIYAAEGTSAHELAELCLRSGDWDAAQYVGAVGETPGAAPWSKTMAQHVNTYLATIKAHFDPAADELYVEEKFDALSASGFRTSGTGDCVVWKPATRHLHVFDLKYGAGVPVEVDDNPQIRIYGLGAAHRYHNQGVQQITVWIVQPRCFHEAGPIRRADLDAADLVDFAFDVMGAMGACAAPDAPLVSGDWCRWCPAQKHGKCPERERQLSSVFDEIAAPADIPADDIAARLERAEKVEGYAKALREHAEALAKAGKMPAGMKWVAGRGSRKWAVPEEEVAARLAQSHAGVDFWVRSFPSVAQIEQQIGKQWFAPKKKADDANGLLASLVTKEPGKPKLALASDPRPAIDPATAATAAFSDLE